MAFNNAVNGSNNDFELSSGTFQFADRVRLDGGYAENIGIAYSGGTFTVQGANGNALSSTNPGYINLQSKVNPGRQVKVAITANQTFTDGSSGSIDNQRFGLTTGVDASVDIPFYIYAVINDSDNAIAFMVGRIPHYIVAPATTKIGQSGSVVNTGHADLFSLASITAGDYDGNPVLLIGAFRMRFTGATDSWTVQTLTNSDGVGQFHESSTFDFPVGQYGAASGKWFSDNGGTAPADSGGSYQYRILRTGYVHSGIAMPSITTAGVGAVSLTLIPPVTMRGGIINYGYYISGGVTSIIVGFAATTSTINFPRVSSASDSTSMQNAGMTIGSVWASRLFYFISYV